MENECKAFKTMVDRYNGLANSVFIADRGYESYNNFAHVEHRRMYYLFRVKDISSNGILHSCVLPDAKVFDTEISFILTEKRTKDITSYPLKYKCIRDRGTFDYINNTDKPYYPLKFKALRFLITDNTYECIITNLPADEFCADKIKEIYGMR